MQAMGFSPSGNVTLASLLLPAKNDFSVLFCEITNELRS